MKVDPDWWKKLFDEIYLLTDARSVCDDVITGHEVDLICELLQVAPGQNILDLCGGHGRHSFELYSRGICSCTLLDYSQYLIDHARKHAKKYNYRIELIRADARNTGLSAGSFDHVIIMGNSLGYISEQAADLQIISEAERVLRPGGWILIDVMNGNSLQKSFKPNAWHEIGKDIVVCRTRELYEKRIYAREMVLSKKKGLIKDQTYSMRYYEPDSLFQLLKKAGFTSINVKTGFSPHEKEGDYGFMNNRMIGTGQKPRL